MLTLRQWVRAGLVLLVLSGCGRLTASQLGGTATVLGCWPYGLIQPPPPATPVLYLPPTPGSGTPTPIITATATPTRTPVATFVACTPAPLTPTLTASPTPSPTPWTRPTEQTPGGKDNPPVNMSNMPGYDVEPAIAVHPSDGWPALVWSNWIWEFPDDATVFVKVQDPATGVWRRGSGVNTGSVRKAGGSPGILVDRQGRIHVAFEQDKGPVYTVSTDLGQTWSDPEALPTPGGTQGAFFFQLALDSADQLHILYDHADACFDCFHYVHAQRPAAGGEAWSWQDDLAGGAKQLYGDLTTVTLPNGTIRTIVGIGAGTSVRLVTQDGLNAPWTPRTIPNQTIRLSPQVVFWVDIISFVDQAGQQQVCTSWAQYSKSGVFSSCSLDAGVTWQDTTVIAFHHEPPPDPTDPTPDPEQPTPATGDGTDPGGTPSFDRSDRGYRPEVLYEPTTDQLLAIWTWRGKAPGNGLANPYTVVYSYRPAHGGAWLPLIDGDTQEPPLALFAATRRNAARSQRLAYRGQGVAYATWIEVERDESIEVYVGAFTPAALLTRKEGP